MYFRLLHITDFNMFLQTLGSIIGCKRVALRCFKEIIPDLFFLNTILKKKKRTRLQLLRPLLNEKAGAEWKRALNDNTNKVLSV